MNEKDKEWVGKQVKFFHDEFNRRCNDIQDDIVTVSCRLIRHKSLHDILTVSLALLIACCVFITLPNILGHADLSGYTEGCIEWETPPISGLVSERPIDGYDCIEMSSLPNYGLYVEGWNKIWYCEMVPYCTKYALVREVDV